MTPQAIGELIDARHSVAGLSRHDLAVEVLADLRRQGTLAEAGLPDLPPHPDLPVAGEWMRYVHRHKGKDEARHVWHLYSGHAWQSHENDHDDCGDPTCGQWGIGALCGVSTSIWTMEPRGMPNLAYVQRSTETPEEDVCKRCLRKRADFDAVERLLGVTASAEVPREPSAEQRLTPPVAPKPEAMPAPSHPMLSPADIMRVDEIVERIAADYLERHPTKTVEEARAWARPIVLEQFYKFREDGLA